ncbi:MAG: hypothetical protein M1837_003172 [Sclerophora amabilis]|nr:MAG: hypothetical protein M1837_003172 [Sclerophora amabilis]
MEEEDDDFYTPAEPSLGGQQPESSNVPIKSEESNNKPQGGRIDQKMEEDLEEGEEEEEEDESDSDIDIITERKDGSKPEPPQQPAKYNSIRNLPARTASSDPITKPPPQIKAETPAPGKPATTKTGSDYPAVATSKIDVDAKPIYDQTGKAITELDIDEDLKEHDKPWRVPGSDLSDYFNYGFDEFTWTLYCMKQDKTRARVEGEKKEFANGMMMGMDGMPAGMPGMPAPSAAPQTNTAMPQMPGMPDIPPEMQAMMAQMMASGMDPSQMAQMDPAMFQAAMGQANGGNQAQGFNPGQQGFGAQAPNQQQVGFGMDPSMMAVDGNRNRQGNFGVRGRGGGNRRNW